MSYDFNLADRIRNILHAKSVPFKEKEMFGGVAFMVWEKMCVGIIKNDLMARIDPAIMDEALTHKGTRPMDFAGRPMKGYVYVNPSGVDTAKDLRFWVERCLEFNPKAPLRKKSNTGTPAR